MTIGRRPNQLRNQTEFNKVVRLYHPQQLRIVAVLRHLFELTAKPKAGMIGPLLNMLGKTIESARRR